MVDMYLYTLALSFALSIGAIGLLLKSPLRRYFGDAPDHRKVHQYTVPRFGGLGMVIAFLLVELAINLAWSPPLSGPTQPFFGCLVFVAMFLLFAGTLDDVHPVSFKVKFMLQFAMATVVVCVFGHRFETVSLAGHPVDLGGLGYFISIFWLVAVMNAFNIIDGIDGLAAGVALCGFGTMGVLANANGSAEITVLCLVLAGLTGGFLYFNLSRRHKVFLGDTGSQFLGAMLGLLAMEVVSLPKAQYSVFIPLLAVGYPLFDISVAMVRRFMKKSRWSLGRRFLSMFQADNEHLHHRMVYWGMSHLQSTFLLVLVAGSMGAAAIVVSRVEWPWRLAMVGYLSVALFLILNRLGYVGLRPWLTLPRVKAIPGRIVGVIEPDEVFMHSLKSYQQDKFEFLGMPRNITKFFGNDLVAVLLYNAASERFEEEWQSVLRASEFQDCPAVVIAGPEERQKVTALNPEGFKSVLFVDKPVRIPELIREIEGLCRRMGKRNLRSAEGRFSLAELAIRRADAGE